MVFAAVTNYRRGPAARYDATTGMARIRSSVESVTTKMNISREELNVCDEVLFIIQRLFRVGAQR